MIIACMTFTLRAPWVHSLKEKRMIVKSLVSRLHNRFNVSASEIDRQDTHLIIPCNFLIIYKLFIRKLCFI